MQEPHVQLIVDGDPVPLPLQAALSRVGARISIRSLGKAADAGVSPNVDLCVILPKPDQPPDLLDRIVSHASDRACATLVIEPPPAVRVVSAISPSREASRELPGRRLSAPEAQHVSGLNVDELTGRIRALCDVRRPLRRLQDEVERLRRSRCRSAESGESLEEQLRLAGQVQTDLLPEPLTGTHPLAISTLYLPADYVSGDIYDIARLDETNIGFSIADATGHGLPAALLTLLIKKSLRGKEIFQNRYRIVEPDELLERLNEDMLHAPLRQCQFITALHAVLDRATGRIRWARGGCPYPILVRPGEAPRLLPSDGGLIGAFDQQFEVASIDLLPGDTLVFHTDGLDALLLHRSGVEARTIVETDWARILADEGVESAIAHLRERVESSGPDDWHQDDITLIALHMAR